MEISRITADVFWKGEARIRGVAAEDGARFETEIYVRGERIFDYSCTCPEGNSFRGPCAHARALWEAYRERRKEEKRPPVYTSPAVREMVGRVTQNRLARAALETGGACALLVPRLCPERGKLKMECLIKGGGTASSRPYLIRDLAAFARAVRENGWVRYGADLDFYHSPQAFAPESRPLLSLILEGTQAYGLFQEEFRGRTASVPPLRAFPLTRSQTDRFFAAMRGKTVTVKEESGREREFALSQEAPRIQITVRRAGADGLRVSFPDGFLFLEGEERVYVADGGRLCACGGGTAAALRTLFAWPEDGGRGKDITAARRDIPLFYDCALKPLKELGLLDMEGIGPQEYALETLKAYFDFDSGGPDEIRMTPVFCYGDRTVYPLDEEEPSRASGRDAAGEFAISRLIANYFSFREADRSGRSALVIRGDSDALYRLLDEGIEAFEKRGTVRISEAARAVRIVPPPPFAASVTRSGGWLDLSFQTGNLSAAQMETILAAYREKKHYVCLKKGEFLRLTDRGLETACRFLSGFSCGKQALREKTLRVPAACAPLLEEWREKEGVSLKEDEAVRKLTADLKRGEKAPFRVPKELAGVLYDYQKAGVAWLQLLDRNGLGGILADDMGLGKTLQVIALIWQAHREEETGRPLSLVVCPASLICNWIHEFERFAPALPVTAVTGTASERSAILARRESGVLVTSYDLLRRDLAAYRDREFRFAVLDEAQAIKNTATQTTRAAKAIRARSRLALTGTPVENRLGELWSLFDYLMPGFLGTYRTFRERWELPAARGDREAADGLRRLIRPFLLRRMKRDVMRELPEKIEQIVYSAPEGRQRAVYQAEALKLKRKLEGLDDAGFSRGRMEILSGLTRLRQLCCDPSLCYESFAGPSAKLETCVSLLSSAVEAGHRALVFSQFASMLQILAVRLKKEGIGCFLLTGATPVRERDAMVSAFGTAPEPVFLISLKAGGLGLNLTAADVVVLYDPWWNDAAQNQAADRAWRIGQSRDVTVLKLILKGTIEENILKLQEAKQRLTSLVEESALTVSFPGREEILKLLDGAGQDSP